MTRELISNNIKKRENFKPRYAHVCAHVYVRSNENIQDRHGDTPSSVTKRFPETIGATPLCMPRLLELWGVHTSQLLAVLCIISL